MRQLSIYILNDKKDWNPMFSIITPTYNRAHTLHRVYYSLLSQTDKDFEWIIVDDHSTDDTSNLIDEWKTENPNFSILYIYLKENKGKPNALNIGLRYCKRPITIIADSDDSFESNTISELKQLWKLVDNTKKSEKIASIWTLVKDEKENLVGELFPNNFWEVSFENRILKNNIKGEKWHSWRTEILKKYKMFHSNYSFVSESATWNRINKDYNFLCVNLIHRKYYSSPDGLILKKKSRLALEKLKFYNSYYQLYKTSNYNMLKYSYFHSFAFDYVKSTLIYKKRDKSLGFAKYICCLVVSFFYLPLRTISYFRIRIGERK